MDVKGLLEKNGGKVFSINSNSTVEDAIRVMSNNKVSAIIVSESDKTVGIFTERDVVRCYINSNGKNFHVSHEVVSIMDDTHQTCQIALIVKIIAGY